MRNSTSLQLQKCNFQLMKGYYFYVAQKNRLNQSKCQTVLFVALQEKKKAKNLREHCD